MTTCTITSKACGFKSVEEVAKLNGVTSKTVRQAFREDYAKFRYYLYRAALKRLSNQQELIGRVTQGDTE